MGVVCVVSRALVHEILENICGCAFVISEELLLLIVPNVARRLGPGAHVDHALLNELAELLLMIPLLRVGVVTELSVIDLDETIRRLNIAALLRSDLAIRLCV
jgi:hypothetical protein